MTKQINYKDQSAGELQKHLAEKRAALQTFRFGVSGSRTKNVKEGRTLRKDIARIMTVLNTQATK
jgi:ribosomal protein L29